MLNYSPIWGCSGLSLWVTAALNKNQAIVVTALETTFPAWWARDMIWPVTMSFAT
jgi:hypothetical protein